MKKIGLLLFALIFSLSIFAQDQGVKGKIISRGSKESVSKAKVTLYLPTGELVVQTNSDGIFFFSNIEEGVFRMTVEADGYLLTNLNVRSENYMKDLREISISPAMQVSDFGDDVFTELDVENEAGIEDIPSVLSSRKDVYDNIAGYKFSTMRHLNRGYKSSTSDVYINGIKMNDALSGYASWSLFSGLNEVTREKETVTGLEAAEFGVGGVNGITNINAYASRVKKGFRSSILTNSGLYRFRLMLTYSSGELDNGWSYAVSASTRLGGNDWITGVYYKSFAYYAGAEKRFNDKHKLSLALFASPSQRGAQMGATQETYDLMGSNFYNSNWGYQNGEVRNARVRDTHEPVAILNYHYTPNDDFKMIVGLSYRMGRNGYSALDWYDAPDPRPDYYRNLPSYYDDPAKAAWVEEGWLTDPNIAHLNWQNLYDVNRNSFYEGTTTRSKYVIEERHVDQDDFNANINIVKDFSRHFKLAAGAALRWNKSEYYKSIKDLLGGDFYLDVDQFAERDFGTGDVIQNNLLTPNRQVTIGDKYGYDYFAHVNNYKLWANIGFNNKGLLMNLGLEGGYETFWREGLFQKGLFPDNSLGNSEKQNFLTYTAKYGISYKFNARHRIYANVGYVVSAPNFQSAFLSPRTRNTVIPNITTQKSWSEDINYAFKLGEFDLRLTGYYSIINDQTHLISFYDDLQRAYTNFAMSGINQRNMGVELGLKVPLGLQGLSLQGAVSYGNYVYTNNPYVTQTVDNSDKIVVDNAQVFWEGYKVPSTPQLASDLGLHYRSPDYLFVSVDVGYYDQNYISMNPLRRTDFALVGIDPATSEGAILFDEMVDQEKFDAAFIVNANIGKSWYFKRKYQFGVSVDVKNILNNKNIRTGGYEQMRLSSQRDSEGNTMHYTPFDSKYFYLFGINYMVNVYFRF